MALQGYVDLNNVQTIATGMLNLITDLDTLLASDPNFLLGVWTNRAVRFPFIDFFCSFASLSSTWNANHVMVCD